MGKSSINGDSACASDMGHWLAGKSPINRGFQLGKASFSMADPTSGSEGFGRKWRLNHQKYMVVL